MLQINEIRVTRNGKYEDFKPNMLVTQVRLSDEQGNRQELTLDDATTLAIINIIRDAAAAQAKKTAAEVKTAVDSALAAPMLENEATLKLA
nr:hypothetical protein NCPCFENI_01088 [Cupriavidus sp.]